MHACMDHGSAALGKPEPWSLTEAAKEGAGHAIACRIDAEHPVPRTGKEKKKKKNFSHQLSCIAYDPHVDPFAQCVSPDD